MADENVDDDTAIAMELSHSAALAALNRLLEIADENEKVDFIAAMLFLLYEATATLADAGWTREEIIREIDNTLDRKSPDNGETLH